jgi:hypothetical protein
MNRVAVLVLLTGGLVGCAEHNKNTLASFNCVIDPYPGPCAIAGTKANPTPGLRKTGNGLQMTPKALCTQAPADVTVTITPPNTSPPGTIIIAAKNLQNAVWLLGTNNNPENPDEIRVSIPQDVENGKYHYVVVDSVTGDCLDPRWDVQ